MDNVQPLLDDEDDTEYNLELRPHKWAADKWITKTKNPAMFTQRVADRLLKDEGSSAKKTKIKEIQGSYCIPSPVVMKRRGSNQDMLFQTSYQHQMATAQGYMTHAKSKMDIVPGDSVSRLGRNHGKKSMSPEDAHRIP